MKSTTKPPTTNPPKPGKSDMSDTTENTASVRREPATPRQRQMCGAMTQQDLGSSILSQPRGFIRLIGCRDRGQEITTKGALHFAAALKRERRERPGFGVPRPRARLSVNSIGRRICVRVSWSALLACGGLAARTSGG